MKFITTTNEKTGEEEIFVFSSEIPHKVMAEAVEGLKNSAGPAWERVRRTPVAAGFVEGGRCVGRSETLNLAARPQDTELLP